MFVQERPGGQAGHLKRPHLTMALAVAANHSRVMDINVSALRPTAANFVSGDIGRSAAALAVRELSIGQQSAGGCEEDYPVSRWQLQGNPPDFVDTGAGILMPTALDRTFRVPAFPFEWVCYV